MSKEKVIEFFDKFYSPNAELLSLENSLHEKQGNDKVWVDILMRKSSLMREAFIKREALIDEYIRPFLDKKIALDEETADEFVDQCYKRCMASSLDFFLMDDMLMLVLDYYVDNNLSHEKIIRASSILSFVQSKYLCGKKDCQANESCEKGLLYLDEFKDFPTKTRSYLIMMIFNSFYCQAVNLILDKSFDFIRLKEYLDKAKKRIDEVKKFSLSEDNKSRLKNTENDCYIVAIDILMTSDNKSVCFDKYLVTDESKKEAKKYILNECYDQFKKVLSKCKKEDELLTYTHYLYCSYRLNKISSVEYTSKLESLYAQKDTSDVNDNSDIFQSQSLAYILSVGIDLSYSYLNGDYSKKESDEKIGKIYKDAITFFSSINQKDMNSDLLQATNDYLTDMLPIIKGDDEMIRNLFKLLFYQQTSTAIHSRMVELISDHLVPSVIKECPTFFEKTPIYDSSKSDKDNLNNYLSYIDKAGLLHDIGKTPFWDIINMQTRKITNGEFNVLKNHPEVGYDFLNSNKYLAPYADVALFHHRFYDDTYGYPDKKASSSPYKPFIDIVTVADSLDAGTDRLGRNYTKGKSFETMLNEFKDQKGTRYSPVVVDAILNDKDVQKRLSFLTGEGGKEIYEEVYLRFLDKNILAYDDNNGKKE